jgi:hypothetical protein
MIIPLLVLDCPVNNFRSRAAFFTVDKDGHAWTFLGDSAAEWAHKPVQWPSEHSPLEFVVTFLTLRRCDRSRRWDQPTVRPLHSVVQTMSTTG